MNTFNNDKCNFGNLYWIVATRSFVPLMKQVHINLILYAISAQLWREIDEDKNWYVMIVILQTE